MILSLGAWASGTVRTIVLSQWHWLDRGTGRENNSLRVVATNNRAWRREPFLFCVKLQFWVCPERACISTA
jgi:hypothetical protein